MVRSSNKRKRTESEIEYFSLGENVGELGDFRRRLSSLYQSQALCDVTFAVQGVKFQAHKVILAASSSFLGAMMTAGMAECRQDTIELDSDPALFKFILDYIYGLQISVSSLQLLPLLGLCNEYCMTGLRNRLASTLENILSVDTSCAILAAADANNCLDLKESALRLVFSNFAAAAKTGEFLHLSVDLFEAVVCSDDILDCDEALVFEAVEMWLESHKEGLSPEDYAILCARMLQRVRFPLMDSCYLSDVIKTHPLMSFSPCTTLLMEAFEHHALLAAGRTGAANSSKTKKRRQSCAFTHSTELAGHEDAVSAVLCIENTYLVSGSWDSSIKIWSLQNWTCLRTLSDHTSSILSLCHCNGRLISCSDDGVIKVWAVGTWTCVRTTEGHEGSVNALVECKSRLASAGDDGNIKLWNMASWSCEVTVHHSSAEEGGGGEDADDEGKEEVDGNSSTRKVDVLSLAVFEDKLVSGGDDASFRIWNTNTWICERIIRAHNDEVWTIQKCGNFLVTGSVDGTIKVWKKVVPMNNNLPNNIGSSSLPDNYQSINDTNSSSCSNGGNMGQCDWVCQHTIRCDGPVYVLCCLDNKIVSAGSCNRISVWKPPSSNSYDDWSLHTHFETDHDIWALTQSKGRLISGNSNGVIKVWL